jgi:hypothetical protein
MSWRLAMPCTLLNGCLRLDPVSHFAPSPVSWLWPGRLALGKLALLDGDPGLGKSLVALDLCARLSTGRPPPGCDMAISPANAIVLNGEDSAADTIRPRLETLGADLDRVFIMHSSSEAAAVRFPGAAQSLRAAVCKTRARLIVIDPVMAFLGEGVNAASDMSVRQALQPLMRLAADEHCVILMVRHLNKAGGFHSVYRGGGSIGFVGICRSAWLIAREPYRPERCVLAQVKNNLAAPQASLSYLVESKSDGLLLSWLGESCWSANQLLAEARKAPDTVPPRERAKLFLKEALKDGPRHSRELWTILGDKHLSKRTLYRAKQDLGIRVARVNGNGRPLSFWLLPGQKLSDRFADQDVDIEEYLTPLREMFPEPTPMDDL